MITLGTYPILTPETLGFRLMDAETAEVGATETKETVTETKSEGDNGSKPRAHRGALGDLMDSYNKPKGETSSEKSEKPDGEEQSKPDNEEEPKPDEKSKADTDKEESEKPKPDGEDKSKGLDTSKYEYLKTDVIKEIEAMSDDPKIRERLLERENDYRKWQSIAEKRKVDSSKPQTTSEEQEQIAEFFKDFKEDAFGALVKYKPILGDKLPDVNHITKQIETGGDVATRLQQWQEESLAPQVEAKFKLEQGDFVFDPSEAYKAGTPSYYYRTQTEKKENQLMQSVEQDQTKSQEVVDRMMEQRNKDFQYIKDTFYPAKDGEGEEVEKFNQEQEKALTEDLSVIDNMFANLREGKLEESNPLALKTIYRGVHFDKLLSSAIENERSKIHQKYQQHGLYLPDDGEKPTDVSKIKDESGKNGSDKRRRINPHSPMSRAIGRYAQ